MEVYKNETREIIRRFIDHRISFPECIAALDAAYAELPKELTGEQLAELRALMLANNERVMNEMERRRVPPEA
jgi:hypothetical protein